VLNTSPLALPTIDWGGDVALTAGPLADIAPTLLDLMGLLKPLEMNGHSPLRTCRK
jgi:bisphosphoglycerate-independent phosphoglycerate mutase (AlkP superfamily)